MKIKVAVVGPLEGALKHLFLAKGTTSEGEECSVLLRQSGKNVLLTNHSSSPSLVGKQQVITWKGDLSCEGVASKDAKFEFEATPLLKEYGVKKESLQQLVERQGNQIKELTEMVSELVALQEKPANADEVAKTATEPTKSE